MLLIISFLFGGKNVNMAQRELLLLGLPALDLDI